MSTFNMVASMNESTVVAEYTSESRRSDSYQSEAELEKEFIRMLTEQSYEYLQIHLEAELIENLKHKSQPYGLTTGSAGGLDEPLRGIFRYRL